VSRGDPVPWFATGVAWLAFGVVAFVHGSEWASIFAFVVAIVSLLGAEWLRYGDDNDDGDERGRERRR
jgi:hypothetical protein